MTCGRSVVWLVMGLVLAVALPAVAKDETEWYDEALGAIGAGDLKAGVAALKQAVTVDPRYRNAWEKLAELLEKLGRHRQAARVRAVAEKAPAARFDAPPPLNDEQRRALADDEDPVEPGTPPPPPKPDPKVPPLVVPEQGKPRPMTKLNRFDKGQYCDLAVDAAGTLHAIFTDAPDHFKPAYLYYRSSADKGATWSEAKNLSDDESGQAAAYCRLLADAQGRLYAIWKYGEKDALIDGPGGNQAGVVVYRCLSAGTWSRIVRLVDKKNPAYSWFAATGPDGAVNVVWSQMTQRALELQGWGAGSYANLVQRVPLDGARPGQVTVVTAPPPMPTEAELADLKAAGKPIPYDRLRPTKDGLINLRGYITATGAVRFVGEDPGLSEGPNPTGQRMVMWDGAERRVLHAYERFKTYNNFNSPPVLLVDKHGREHLIRAPENAEAACVRDYPLEDGALGDPTNIVSAQDGKGAIIAWQAVQLPGGRMAVTVALSLKGGARADDAELYVSFSEGDGEWSKPLSVTDNAGRKSGAMTPGPAGVTGILNTYLPRYATVAADGEGRPCMLMVNSEYSSFMATTIGMTAPKEGMGAGIGGATESPMVFFLRL